MPKGRKSSFTQALEEAQKRLEKALNERTKAQAKLAALALEIPNLERIIRAFDAQSKDSGGGYPLPRDSGVAPASVPGVVPPAPITAGEIHKNLEKFMLPEISPDMGSVPAVSGQPASELTEDELLVDEFPEK